MGQASGLTVPAFSEGALRSLTHHFSGVQGDFDAVNRFNGFAPSPALLTATLSKPGASSSLHTNSETHCGAAHSSKPACPSATCAHQQI